MSHYLEHPQFYNKPIHLSEQEMHDPYRILKGFFLDYNLNELREILQDICEMGMTCDIPPYHTGESRANLLLFCKKIELLFEAAFVVSSHE